MDVLLVGGGGREAALAWRLSQSPKLGTLWTTHVNPGFPEGSRVCPSGPVDAVAAELGVGLVVIGPEAPLAEGLVDSCEERGIPAFGPTAAAARLEASKGFAKEFMDRHHIPTAAYSLHSSRADALEAVVGPCVVKADGLAAGKGVYVCGSREEACKAVNALFDGAFGQAGARVVIEELMNGPEISLLALCDGDRFVTFPPAQDHKRRFDGDEGPNTGGMGAYAPVAVPDGFVEDVGRTVIEPVLQGMKAEGHPFRGVLYVGLMLTDRGPKVLEFNCRFGDPECQPLMTLLDQDLLPLLVECAEGRLSSGPLKIRGGVSCCVVMASGGYPGAVTKGHVIKGLEKDVERVWVFQAGTSQNENGDVVTDGGRVLGVTAWGKDFGEARSLAYSRIAEIHWEGADWRTDIGWRTKKELR
ncbi:MAG: phosphoribosylamine--glycine ligase [Myxococcota bacterium]|nr:phosphoribosylamine--glycine ligase [Myxococcota bacterium]